MVFALLFKANNLKRIIMENNSKAKQIVLAFLNAVNKEDFKEARSYTADDLFFNGVMGKRNGAGEYFADMEKMLFKYDIKKVFTDGDDICVVYDISMKDKKIFTIGLYHFENEKIKTIQVVFDPRPLL
jgi:predicted ester cyclase